MLYGTRVTLRQVRSTDLDTLYAAHADIRNRGSFFPLGVQSEPAFQKSFADGNFWSKDEGMLIVETPAGELAGHIEFFKPVVYWDAYELSYQLYDERFAGGGLMTEAVQLLVDYLFGSKKVNRIHLVIHPDNVPSRRIADKCGFQLEGTVRGAFFNRGRSHDVLLHALLRDDPRPWHEPAGKHGGG